MPPVTRDSMQMTDDIIDRLHREVAAIQVVLDAYANLSNEERLAVVAMLKKSVLLLSEQLEELRVALED